MYQSVAKKRVLLIAGLVLILGILGLINYLNNQTTLKLTWIHAVRAEIYDSENSSQPIKVTNVSGTTLHLNKKVYYVRYTGSDGYESSSKLVDLSNASQRVYYDPPYSEVHLQDILKNEGPVIQSALGSAFPAINQYKVQSEHLYKNGEWYGATLEYIGNDIFNSDTLRVVAHKVDGRWSIPVDHPDITLSALLYPKVPVDVLDAVNAE